MSKKLLYTRQVKMPVKILRQLQNHDIEVLSIPLIQTRPISYQLPQTAFDWLFFTSVNTVEYFDFSRISQGIKILAIGNKTAGILRSKGLKVDFQPKQGFSEGLMMEWEKKFVLPQRICLPHSSRARPVIKESLVKLGHEVTDIVIYELIFPPTSKEQLRDLLISGQIDYAIFASPSAWENFYQVCSNNVERYQEILKQVSFISIGPVTSKAIQASDFKIAIEPDIHDMDHLYQTLFDVLTMNHQF